MLGARTWTLAAVAVAWAVPGAAQRGGLARPMPPPLACTGQIIGPLAANVPSVEVQPQFRLNGKPFPVGKAGTAVFTLWASQASVLFDGPQLTLGRTDEAPGPVRVVPGVYDVYYSWLGGTRVPRNQITRVMRRVALRQDGVLTIDVAMIAVSGEKRHNGVPFADDGSAAVLSLRSVNGRGEVPLGGTLPSEFSVRIIPGTYTLHYDWTEGSDIPRNRDAAVRRLRLSTDRSNLVLDVPSVVQDFAFLHNGQPFPASVVEHGHIALSRADEGEVRIGSTHLPPPTVRLIPGAYDVHWRYAAGAAVPRNEDATLLRGLLLDGSPQVIDVPSVEVSGDVRLNGQVPPATAIENGRLSVSSRKGPDRAYLGETRYAAYQARVVPGRYDVVYEHLTGGSVVPANPRATVVRGWNVADEPHRVLDIPVGTFEGSFLLNGASFPASEIESGTIYALPVSGEGTPVSLGSTSYGGFSRRLVPGLYRTAYGHLAGASVVPANTLTAFGPPRQVFQGDGPAPASDVLDVAAATLTVTYEHNGTPLPQGGPQNATIYLHRGDNFLRLVDAEYGPAERIAMEGRFDLFYQYREGPGLPQNVLMPFGCWKLVR